VSVSSLTNIARLVPIEVPVGPNSLGRIPTFRWIAAAQVTGDNSGGECQIGFTLPTGVQYKGTEWSLDTWSVSVSTPMIADRFVSIQVRGGETISPLAWEWYRESCIPTFGSLAPHFFYQYDLATPHFPMRMEGDNSFVIITVKDNRNAVTMAAICGGHIYLPANLSSK